MSQYEEAKNKANRPDVWVTVSLKLEGAKVFPRWTFLTQSGKRGIWSIPEGDQDNCWEMNEEKKRPEAGPDQEPEDWTDEKRVIDGLNKLTGRKGNSKILYGDSHLRLIKSRIDEFSLEDVIWVTDFMVGKWIDDPKFSAYLVPDTLFAKSNFKKYRDMWTAPKGKGVKEDKGMASGSAKSELNINE